MDQVNLVMDSVRAYLIEIGRFLPKLTGALIVLVLGWLIAKAMRWAIVHGLTLARFNVISEKAGVDDFLKRGGSRKTTIDVLAILGYWLVMLITLLTAFNTLGLGVVSDLLRRVVLFVPHVIVAVLIIAIGLYFARLLAESVITYGKNVGLEDVEILGRITRYAIMTFVVILALSQMDIGGEILKNAFYIVFGAACFGAALAFGLGSQKLAGELLERFVQTRGRKKS
jgi:Mechanosensitive ion channel, conserved TM helix